MVRIAKDLDDAIENEDVMLVEDIVDTGFTLRYLLQTLAGRNPNSISVCTFLDRRLPGGSCRCRSTFAALKFPTASSSASDWTITSYTETWNT